MFMSSPLPPGRCDVRGGSPREASSSIIKAGGVRVSAFMSSPHNQGFDPPAPSAQNGNELADEVIVWLKEESVCERERVIACVFQERAQRPVRCLDNEEALLNSLWSHYF